MIKTRMEDEYNPRNVSITSWDFLIFVPSVVDIPGPINRGI